jgi:hypothetical protein
MKFGIPAEISVAVRLQAAPSEVQALREQVAELEAALARERERTQVMSVLQHENVLFGVSYLAFVMQQSDCGMENFKKRSLSHLIK